MTKHLPKLLWILAAVGLGLALLYTTLCHAAVPVTPGPEADALAHEVERAVDADAWARTRTLRWSSGRREHLWDRDRGYARVRFSGHEVLLDLTRVNGRAWTGGQEIVESGAQRALLDAAYRWHLNDAYWLNPLVKLFDDGVTRSFGTLGGARVLQVAYSSGGVTPGDHYQWILDANGRPTRWRVWAQVLPVPGMEFTWEDWIRLGTGAWISRRHEALGIPVVVLTDVVGAATFAGVEAGEDPFAPIAP